VGVGEQQYQVRLADRQPDEEQDIDEVANIAVKSLCEPFRLRFRELLFYLVANPPNWPRPV
jgi:hypothetical protein